MIQVQQVTKRYGKLLANDHITFQVEDGQIAVLLGPNGAGKSTLIKCITGLLRFEGDITIDGHPNKSLAAKRLLGYIPEMPAVYDLLTVWEHLEFIGRAYQLDDWQSYGQSLLERFELWDKKDKLGKELSKGMQQKLSICCALLPRPKTVLFDEPLVGLDPHAIKELKALIGELKAEGAAILISTHMLDSVNEFWDKVLILMQGRIAAVRTRREIEVSGENLEQLFFSITEGERTEA